MLKRNLYLNTVHFTDDQVIIQDSEDKLQKSVYILNQMIKYYNLKISMDKTKIMALRGKHLLHSKIERDGSILEQVKQFNYLGCKLSLDGEPDFDKKNRFQRICDTITKHLKKTCTDTQKKFYKVVARPTLLYGSKAWVTMKRDMIRLEAAEMHFLKSVKGYTRLDKLRSKIIRKELEIPGIQDVRTKYTQNCINHLERIDNNGLPKHVLNDKPPRTKKLWTPLEKRATRRYWNRSNDLIHGGT